MCTVSSSRTDTCRYWRQVTFLSVQRSDTHFHKCVLTWCSNIALRANRRWCQRRSKVKMLQPNVRHPNVHSYKTETVLSTDTACPLEKNFNSWVLTTVTFQSYCCLSQIQLRPLFNHWICALQMLIINYFPLKTTTQRCSWTRLKSASSNDRCCASLCFCTHPEGFGVPWRRR